RRARRTCAARTRSTPLLLALAVDALSRPGHGFEPLRGDRLATAGADAVGAVLDALQGRIDGVEHALLVVLEGGVELTVVGRGGVVGKVVVALDLLEI